MKLEYLKDKIELFVMFCLFVITAWITTCGIIGYVAAVFFLFVMIIYIFLKINKDSELSTIIVIPIMLSIFQNVYLGIFSAELTSWTIQFLTVLNFLLSCFIFVILLLLYKNNEKSNKKIMAMFIILISYAAISILFLDNINIISIISSLRNVISIFIFYFIGNLASTKLDIKKFEKIIMLLALIAILFGFYEKIIDPSIWKKLNITELWNKKGIAIQSSGLPTNFYSSEKIGGERIRRITSTFADPVNFGTFLFTIFCISWFNNNKKMAILSIIAIVLTVSKGALLGILIFVCVYSFFFHRKKFIWLASLMGVVGCIFLVYAYRTSANSVFLHISGFYSAIVGLIENPLGHGIGSIGVISKQFSGYSANSDITETGLGMIIGQLGIIGLVIYVLYFEKILKKCWKIDDKKEKVLCITLLLSILVNILFNEVALSPNSCALYFIIIGFYSNYKAISKITKKEE